MFESTRLPFQASRRRRAGTVRIVDLRRGQAMSLDARPGENVHVLHGFIWLTEPGRGDDVVAAGGERVRIARGGRVVIEALEAARVVVPLALPRAGVGSWWQWRAAFLRPVQVAG